MMHATVMLILCRMQYNSSLKISYFFSASLPYLHYKSSLPRAAERKFAHRQALVLRISHERVGAGWVARWMGSWVGGLGVSAWVGGCVARGRVGGYLGGSMGG